QLSWSARVVSAACTAIGTIPHPVQSGALIPATAYDATVVVRDSPPGNRLKNSSGAGAEIVACTAFTSAAPQSVVAVVSLVVAASIELKQVPVPSGMAVDPKL